MLLFSNYQLKLKSLNNKILKYYLNFIIKICKKLNIKFSTIILPTKVKRITLLKSPHVYKKSREQFQIKYFNASCNIKAQYFSPELIKFLYLNKPNTIKITLRKIV